jgi:hypothetical protein
LTVDQCRFGSTNQPISLALWGDSHAMAWAPMLDAVQNNGAPVFKLYSLASCQPLLTRMNDESGHDYCDQYNNRTLNEIIALKSQGLTGVVLSARWVVLRHPSISRYDTAPEHLGIRDLVRRARPMSGGPGRAAPEDSLAEGLSATLTALQRAGLRVVLLLDPPEVRQPIPACVFVHYSSLEECGISRQDYEQYTSDVTNTIKALAAEYPSARVIDPTRNFCDDKRCPAFAGKIPTLFDDDHISASAAVAMGAVYRRDIEWLYANQ